jgi:ABC-type sugar transport system ATPase subunit
VAALVAASVTTSAAVLRRLLVPVVVEADITEAATVATFAVEVTAAVAAAAIVVVLDGKATSAFPDKSIQKLFGSVRAARSARPSTLARYGIARVFGWHERAAGTGSSRDKE